MDTEPLDDDYRMPLNPKPLYCSQCDNEVGEDETLCLECREDAEGAGPQRSMTPPFSIGDIVTVPIKNRWGIDCAATIEAIHAETVDATVWNMDGPGADRLVTGIPHSVCKANTQNSPEKSA